MKVMIHLHTRSFYSLLESSLPISRIIALARKNGQTAAALTDHRSMYGAMEFLHACKKASLKPILGLDLEIDWQGMLHPVVLLARDTKGLQDLFLLSTKLKCGQPVLPADDLAQYASHAILITGAGDEELRAQSEAGMEPEIAEYFSMLKDSCPNTYFGVSLQESPVFARANRHLESIAQSLGIKSTALSGIEYENEQDHETVQLLQAIAKNKLFSDPQISVRLKRHWRSEKQMRDLYTPSQLEQTEQIAAMIEDYDLPKASLPAYSNPGHIPSNEFLVGLCRRGLAKRMHQRVPKEYSSRLEHELDVIVSVGFADYFLIVYDFILEARRRGILVGPGRGSAAGSLVSWCLGISHVDPIANGLLFERFLNPERISMPDIDTDFPDNRRDEIIEYVHQRYGDGHAAHIVTFARLKPKMALRDAGRALGIPQREIESLTKLIPSNPQLNPSLEQVYQSSEAFASLVRRSAPLKRLYQMARAIEGFPRHESVHAGGIVLSREPITNQAPLTNAGAGLPAVQFTMEYLEELGLIKFDFLALRNLSLLDEMRRKIEQLEGKPLDLLKLDLNEPAVYQLLAIGDTLGVFQLESEGIRRLIEKYVPERFEDIAAILALYRPGPMKNINVFLDARHGRGRKRSMHPLLDPILAETGGIFLYQEQIMEASRVIGGFSLAQADILRKAMSKKKRDVMEEWKERFIAGAAKRGIERQTAAQIFETMEQFADYGFNKSHSYAYGLIVYQMAWIKARYPLIFYTCAMEGTVGSAQKTQAYLSELQKRRIPLYGPDLNRSGLGYQMEGKGIRMPLTLVKGLGSASVREIIAEREASGPFDDPALSMIRLSRRKISAAQISDLIRSGAFDSIHPSREGLLESQEEILRLTGVALVDPKSQMCTLDGVTHPDIPKRQADISARLASEMQALGFYVSRHPSAMVRKKHSNVLPISAARSKEGAMTISGIVTAVKEIQTKNGQTMAFAMLKDDTGELDSAIMPELYRHMKSELQPGAFFVADGIKDRPKSIRITRLYPLDPGRI